MRLWTLHPKYLDPQGLVALWREALLSRAVLRCETQGYRQHPQRQRFRRHATPLLAINADLSAIHAESVVRDYSFDRSKIGPVRSIAAIDATTGQLAYEWQRPLQKLAPATPSCTSNGTRSPGRNAIRYFACGRARLNPGSAMH